MKTMADHNVPGTGSIPAIMTILLGIFANVTPSDFAAFLSIAVGLYTIFINWPKFLARVNNIIEKRKRKS